ncbi:hypothetical protein GCM10017790_00490 [Amycolatopsis oliviviridis]|uniref:Uncharacterized protein n=1 Tax=Amycolatopsis oliviviridis TaxID=1471590 RepID=A0ABQ3L3E8_9PSEU|nr:hypothetical protein GCM10017790_00490 [Amycolatopsis oliviviridis]
MRGSLLVRQACQDVVGPNYVNPREPALEVKIGLSHPEKHPAPGRNYPVAVTGLSQAGLRKS